MSGRFDSDTQALMHREVHNAAGAEHNLEDWVMRYLQLKPGQHILDLGCGRGKQIFAFARHVGPLGRIDGLDLSSQALEHVASRAAAEGLKNIQGIHGSLDDWPTLLRGRTYDLIVSAYAIYYARDVRNLLRGLRRHLRADGRMFVCGTGAGTNRELLDLAAGLGDHALARFRPVPDFLSPEQIHEVGEAYSRCSVVRLANRVHFSSAESFMTWWTNHNSYVPDLHDAIYREAQARCLREGDLAITKNVIGIFAHA